MHIDPLVAGPADAPTQSGLPRRRVIGAGLGGAAASLLPLLAGRAGATTPPPVAPAPAPTTTAAPERPTDDDVPLLAFAQGVELAIRDLYDIGLAAASFSDVERTVLTTIRESHEAYFQVLSGLLGRLGVSKADQTVVDKLKSSFSGSVTKVLQAAYDVEATAVATHADLLGMLHGTDGAKLIASIMITEARHGTVIADMAGRTGLDDLLVAVKADALTPAGG